MRELMQATQSTSGCALQAASSAATTSLASRLTAGRDWSGGSEATYSGVVLGSMLAVFGVDISRVGSCSQAASTRQRRSGKAKRTRFIPESDRIESGRKTVY